MGDLSNYIFCESAIILGRLPTRHGGKPLDKNLPKMIHCKGMPHGNREKQSPQTQLLFQLGLVSNAG